MKSFSSVFILLLNIFILFVDCQLSAVFKQCGEKNCSELQYCDRHSNICEPCSKVCEKSNHNYDGNRCDSDCQDYIQAQNNRGLEEEIKSIRNLATISLTLTCILFAILLVIALLYHRKKQLFIAGWLRKKLKLKEKSKTDRNNPSVSVTTASGKPDLRLDMPSVGMQTPSVNGNTPSTTSTTLSRRPTEDNTLDYAYDNPVMVSTPSPVSKPHESAL